jgi:hypothetical protein
MFMGQEGGRPAEPRRPLAGHAEEPPAVRMIEEIDAAGLATTATAGDATGRGLAP